jgi:hypothetical protein
VAPTKVVDIDWKGLLKAEQSINFDNRSRKENFDNIGERILQKVEEKGKEN